MKEKESELNNKEVNNSFILDTWLGKKGFGKTFLFGFIGGFILWLVLVLTVGKEIYIIIKISYPIWLFYIIFSMYHASIYKHKTRGALQWAVLIFTGLLLGGTIISNVVSLVIALVYLPYYQFYLKGKYIADNPDYMTNDTSIEDNKEHSDSFNHNKLGDDDFDK